MLLCQPLYFQLYQCKDGETKCYAKQEQLLFLSLVALIDSDEIAAETITLKYFEPGKTFFIQRSVNIASTDIFCILHYFVI